MITNRVYGNRCSRVLCDFALGCFLQWRQNLLPAGLIGLVGFALSVSLIAGCGGAAVTSGQQVKVEKIDLEAQKKADGKEAAKRFRKLSKKIQGKETTGTIKIPWLVGELKKIIKLDANHAAAKFNLSVLLAQDGQTEKAQELMEELLAGHPNFTPALENKAVTLVAAGKIKEAKVLYRKFIDADSKNQTSRLGLARIYLSKNKYKKAIEQSQNVLQQKADSLEAFRIMASSYLGLKDLPMAELVIGRGLSIDKEDIDLMHSMAQLLVARKEMVPALQQFKEIIKLAPTRLDIRAHIATLALKFRDFANAAQQFEAIQKQLPNNKEAKIGAAICYNGMGRFESALEIYTQLLTEIPQDIDVNWNIATLYYHGLRRYDDAIVHYRKYQKSAHLSAKKSKAINVLVAKINQVKNDVAAEEARLVIEKQRHDNISGACLAFREGGNPKPFITELAKTQDLNEIAWGLFSEGQAAMQGGDLAEGESVILCALQLIPSTPQAKAEVCAPMHVLWTQILYQLGRLEEADKIIDKALVCDAENPDAVLIKEQLAEFLVAYRAQKTAEESQKKKVPHKTSKQNKKSKKSKKRK